MRTTKSSPGPASNTVSGPDRESEQAIDHRARGLPFRTEPAVALGLRRVALGPEAAIALEEVAGEEGCLHGHDRIRPAGYGPILMDPAWLRPATPAPCKPALNP